MAHSPETGRREKKLCSGETGFFLFNLAAQSVKCVLIRSVKMGPTKPARFLIVKMGLNRRKQEFYNLGQSRAANLSLLDLVRYSRETLGALWLWS